MNPSTDEDETASSDSHEHDDDDDENDSDPTAQRERIRRNHVWAIISLLEEQAKGPYHLMVFARDAKMVEEASLRCWQYLYIFGGVTHNLLTRFIGFVLFFVFFNIVYSFVTAL